MARYVGRTGRWGEFLFQSCLKNCMYMKIRYNLHSESIGIILYLTIIY